MLPKYHFIDSQSSLLTKSKELKVPMIILDSTTIQLSWLSKWTTRVFSTMMQTGEPSPCTLFISFSTVSFSSVFSSIVN